MELVPGFKWFTVKASKDALTVHRSKRPAIIWLFITTGLLCLTFFIPVQNIFVYHYNVTQSYWLMVMLAIIFTPSFIQFSVFLAGKKIVLDRVLDQVMMNGHLICSLTDLRAVGLDSNTVPGSWVSYNVSGLYLTAANAGVVVIEQERWFGPTRDDLKEIGRAIADYANIKSNIE